MHWLILRGLSREQRHWGEFPAALRAVSDGAQVLLLDLPGAGTERHRASPTEISGIVRDLRARFLELRSALGLDGKPVGLLAVSLGGMVAMQWASDFPDDFAAVVLVNTSASDLSPPWRRMSPAVLWPAARALVTSNLVERERRILAFTTRLRADLPAIAAEYAGFALERPMERRNVLRQLYAAMRFRAPKRLGPPTLVVACGGDLLANPECGRLLADRFLAPLALHPRAGHDLALDDPEWLAAEVCRFASVLRPPTPMAN
jgi:pimeloyl-ACP methyl ester carboxylesterase